jgi:hypothetical protein
MDYARRFAKWLSWESPAAEKTQQLSPSTRFILAAFAVLFFGNAMDAYQLFSIPVPWLAALGQGMLCCYVLIRRKSFRLPGIIPLLILVGWSVGVTVATSLLREYATIMPLDSTTSYGVFITLRIATLLAFVATIYVAYHLLERGCWRYLLKVLAVLGVIVSIVALYSYVAQVHGLPEIPRNRLGTGGGSVGVVSYTYPFHRATGTFREPGLLAAWLILPLAASVILRRRLFSVPSVLIGGVLLLTGSMAGILGVCVGAVAAILLVRPRHWISWRRGLDLVIFGAAIMGIFSVVAVPNEGGTTNLLQVVIQRSAPLVSSGLAGSNRDYIYDFFHRHPMPILGYGLGHANLMFSQATGIAVPVSFLSMYLNIGYSSGMIGLAFLCAWVGWPLLRTTLARRRHGLSPALFWMIGAYTMWLVLSYVTLEELQPPFAVCFAIVVYLLEADRRSDA